MADDPARDIRHYVRSRAWCDWSDFDRWLPLVSASLADPDGAAWPPFELLSLPGLSAAQQRTGAQRWAAQRQRREGPEREHEAARFERERHLEASAHPRLRIGYLSCDFHEHATALLMVEMLEAHDRHGFEIHAYSHGPDDDGPMRRRLTRAVERFHDIQDLPNADAARAIHGDGIDILVDLKGYTSGSRSALLCWRPAPVQASFLGYPGTSGALQTDYLIGDAFVTPASSACDYSEAIACLPHSYQPHGRGRRDEPAASTRADERLPEEAVVLCCFNQAWKFHPAVFDAWCEVLCAVPDSVLWLLADERASGNLRSEALARGVAPHRLVFAADRPQQAHLDRLSLADLVLDTWPYNAHTTASDALWAGVPLVTWAGDSFAARVAGSLLHAVGLPELVTESATEYVALATALASDPPRLRALRARLARQRVTAPLFDVPLYTRNLERLYARMWARHRSGLPPATLEAEP